MSGTIMKTPDVRVEEITLEIQDEKQLWRRRKEKKVRTYDTLLLLPFYLEQFTRHDSIYYGGVDSERRTVSCLLLGESRDISVRERQAERPNP